MSQAAEALVWAAGGLDLSSRMLLLCVAREVPEGSPGALVNRTQLARWGGCSAATVAKALRNGEALGLCTAQKNGWVVFRLDGLPMGDAPPRPLSGVTAGDGAAPPPPAVTTADVRDEFVRRWEREYRQRYAWDGPKGNAAAFRVARALRSRAELIERLDAFFSHPDQYYKRRSHAFSVFASHHNEVVATSLRGQVAGVDDYDDLEKDTQRELQEHRARATGKAK